jgi:ATP phosphoribosyltransferase regulatory subunit
LLATLPEDASERARERLYRRAFADLEDGIPAGSARDALRLLPSLRGNDVLDRAARLAIPEESRGALAALREVFVRLKAYGLAVRIEVDLGLIRDFDYYSGTVFEAHSGRAGLPLLGGGRYDGLLARFGRPAPATGFAIGIERVLEAGAGDCERRPAVLVRYAAGQYETAVGAAASLRALGLIAVIASDNAHAGVVDPACTVIAAGDALRVTHRGSERTVAAGALLDAVRSALGRA